MAHIDPLLQRNKDFAATGAHETAGIVAKFPVYVITCLDPRTDPSAFLGLGLGDAMVIRTPAAASHPKFRRGFAELIGGDEAAPAERRASSGSRPR